MDMIFTPKQVQEKCREQHQDLYMIFVDLSKAFDFVIDEDFGKAVLLSAQLRWTRHVMTMSNNWLPKQVFLQSAWTRHRDIKTC